MQTTSTQSDQNTQTREGGSIASHEKQTEKKNKPRAIKGNLARLIGMVTAVGQRKSLFTWVVMKERAATVIIKTL